MSGSSPMFEGADGFGGTEVSDIESRRAGERSRRLTARVLLLYSRKLILSCNQQHGLVTSFTGDEPRSELKRPSVCVEDENEKEIDDVKLKKWHQQVVCGGPLLTFAVCA
ncbi:uncharacterized [Tachysurus ichikawai]